MFVKYMDKRLFIDNFINFINNEIFNEIETLRQTINENIYLWNMTINNILDEIRNIIIYRSNKYIFKLNEEDFEYINNVIKQIIWDIVKNTNGAKYLRTHEPEIYFDKGVIENIAFRNNIKLLLVENNKKISNIQNNNIAK